MLQYTKVRLGFTCADVWTCWVEIEKRRDMVTWTREKDGREREKERKASNYFYRRSLECQ